MKYSVATGNNYKTLNQKIINTLNSIYYVLYEINLERNSYREFATVPGLHALLSREGNAKELLQTIINKFCKQDYRSRLAAFLEIDTFRDRLEKSNILTYEYRAETVEWALMSILPFEYDEEGKATSVILAVRDISSIKERTDQYQNLIQALATPYANLYTIKLDNGSMQIHHADSYIIDNYGEAVISTGYEHALGLYVNTEVLQEDREIFKPIRTIAGCQKIFAEKRDYSFVYRILRNGEIHHYICNIIKPSEERNEFALGFRNIDDKMAEQELQKLELQNKLDTIEEYRQALEEQMAVVSGLAKDYYSVMLVDYIEDTVTIREARDEDGRQIANFFSQYPTWSEGIKAYTTTRVAESEKEEFYKALSLEAIRTAKGDYTSNYQKVTENGIKHLQFKVAYVTSNKGRPLAVVGTRSIEKEYQDQIKLQETNDKLRRNLNVIGSVSTFFSVLYYVSLDDYSFLSVNPAEYESILNICGTSETAVEAFRRVKEDVIDSKHAEEFAVFTDLATLADRLADRKVVSMQFIGKDAGWVEGYFIAADRDENGRCTHVLWAVHPIQEQKEKDLQYQQALEAAKTEAENANMAKTSFLFSMSHDIRTPMNAIIGFRNMLEKYQDDPVRRADYLEKIGESSNVLLSIINNILEMARIEKGTLEIEETAWSAEQFNDTLYSLFYEMMAQKGIEFSREIDVQNDYVFCDPIKLREIFNNILSNAYKYTNQGGRVKMHLQEVPSSREGYAMYRTTITDTGIGMSEEFLPHLFDEFVRENNTTESRVEGTGLGMAIVKKLITLMEGTIEVESKKGVGTKFVVTIPHKIAQKDNLLEHENVELDPEKFAGKRILLAEDVDLNAEIAIDILSDAGFVVERAEDGVICLDMLKKAEVGYYDLILMDIQMPNMNGYDATRKIRALEDIRKAGIKILAMTANAFEEDKRKAMQCGMDGHIAKPIDIHELMRALSGALK